MSVVLEAPGKPREWRPDIEARLELDLCLPPPDLWGPARAAMKRAICYTTGQMRLPAPELRGMPWPLSRSRAKLAERCPAVVDAESALEALSIYERAVWGWDWPEPGWPSGPAMASFAILSVKAALRGDEEATRQHAAEALSGCTGLPVAYWVRDAA